MTRSLFIERDIIYTVNSLNGIGNYSSPLNEHARRSVAFGRKAVPMMASYMDNKSILNYAVPGK
jgi:hypothetical protein